MAEAFDRAVIFDVDGVLLELTGAEEEVFFTALARFVPTAQLSRDWNSYRIRNDQDIVAEILERHGLPQSVGPEVQKHYLSLLDAALQSGAVATIPIAGAGHLLDQLSGACMLGIATANFCAAAQIRLSGVGLWQPVSSHAFGADGGGHKAHILARALANLHIPKSRIVYVGDNINDVIAGLGNGVHFIGFSTDADRRQQLAAAGALNLAQNHGETLAFIRDLLGI